MQREITSRDNPLVKQYNRLASSRKARREQGMFVTEGIKLTCEAVDAGCKLSLLFATEEALEKSDERIEHMLLSCEGFYRISQQVAEKLTQSVTTQGVFAIFHMLDNSGQPVKIKNKGKYILLSSLQDPGNIGTILRTAAAFGMDGVVLSSDCPDLYSPKVLRATMGGIFRVPVAVVDDMGVYIDILRQQGVAVYAAALNERASLIGDVSFEQGCAVVIGNEGSGIEQEMINRCNRSIMIPMQPGSESLNAAMAAGIMMWEMTKA